MNINKNLLLLHHICLIVTLLSKHLYCSEAQKPLVVIAIPAICGNNTDKGYSENILNLFNDDLQKYKTGTLSLAEQPDFGQTRCISHLKEKIGPYTDSNIIFVATSQATGTLTNYIAQSPKIHEQIKAIVYEGYVASFNQSINFALQSKIPFLKNIPFIEYFVPFLTSYLPYFKGTFFPFFHYNPAGQQPFNNISSLPKNIPIIIVHCRQDRVTPYEGAEIAYYQCTTTGHTTYLITIERSILSLAKYVDDGHINIIEPGSPQATDLQRILDSLIDNNNHVSLNPTRYQPDSQRFTKKMEILEKKEEWIKKISIALKLTKYCSILLMAWKIKQYLHTKIS